MRQASGLWKKRKKKEGQKKVNSTKLEHKGCSAPTIYPPQCIACAYVRRLKPSSLWNQRVVMALSPRCNFL